jgi:tripartite-type tricarboxylate transporter receptor subunit TctC
VPYRGAGPAMNDLLGGQVDMSILTPASAMGNIAAGTIKAIGLAADKRHPMLPNVPTANEQSLPGIDLTVWFALYAPAGTPKAIIDKLAAETQKVVGTQAFRDRLLEQGTYADYLGPKALGELTKRDLDYWAPILKAANIKVE